MKKVEYMLISYDDKKKIAKLLLKQEEVLSQTQKHKIVYEKGEVEPLLQHEYASYMIEGIPGEPYDESIETLQYVEKNMRKRRMMIKKCIKTNEVVLTLTSFPRLGVADVFTDPYYPPTGKIACSLFLPDEVISSHVRFPTLTKNIRLRRGRKVVINVPIFVDKHTRQPFMDEGMSLLEGREAENMGLEESVIKPNHIYMDSMCFGMGCCCLQVTIQTTDISEARTLYDQLIPLGPIMLALSAASPAYKGYLSDQDCRWNVISRSVDDRTLEELGERVISGIHDVYLFLTKQPLKKDKYVIPKSRYDTVHCYLSQDVKNKPKYNDIPIVINEEIKKTLIDNDVDELLATHISHLFIRDPLVVFSDLLVQDNNKESGHFENLQSTNWQAVRFKPPPPGTDIGWRVEFRTMEVQISDFENAAYSIFMNLLTRIILFYNLNFYIPISKVNDNDRLILNLIINRWMKIWTSPIIGLLS